MAVRRAITTAAAVALLACATKASAEPKWTMVRSGTLTVIGDQSANTLSDVATKIEQFRTVVASLIRGADRPLPLPTVVFVFGQRRSIESLTPLYNGRPTEAAGYFIPGPYSNYIILTLEGFNESWSVAFHEYTHLLVNNTVRSMPAWLGEGLAEYYSSYVLTDGGRTADIGRPLEGRLAVLRERYLPLAQIIAVDRNSSLYNEGQRRSIFYAESWALTHYLLAEMPNGADRINDYVRAIGEGKEPAEAFAESMGMTPAECDRQLQVYVRRMTFGAMRYKFSERIAKPMLSAPRAITSAEVDAWIGDAQRRVHRDSEAAPRIERAVAAEPRNATAQLALGLLRLAQERTRDGVDALALAAELAPDDFLEHLTYGASLLSQERGDAERDAPAAIAALKHALRMNATSSEAFAWLAYAQMLSPETRADARASIERAITLSPGRIEYRLRYADIRLLQGDVDAARQLLTAIAAVKSDAYASESASRRLLAIRDADRRRRAYEAARAAPMTEPRRTVEVPETARDNSTGRQTTRLLLRDLGPDEQRSLGTLVAVDCSSTEVRFTVKGGDTVLVAAARRMEDVELIAYLEVKDFSISCGVQREPALVYLTWRPSPAAQVGVVGTAVAVEFLPKTFVP